MQSQIQPLHAILPNRTQRVRTIGRSAYPLQRGSACLSCRKRKMKCDASKPVCGQCVKAGRAADCEYDDGKLKSRTQVLQEKIVKLEDTVEVLQTQLTYNYSPSDDSPPIESPLYAGGSNGEQHQLYQISPASSVHNEYGFPPSVPSPSTSRPPEHRRQLTPLDTSWTPTRTEAPHYPPTPSTSGPFDASWTDISPQIASSLVEIFLTHRSQCLFEINIARFHASLNGPPPLRPHPALMMVIYAIASHFSMSPPLQEREPHFVTAALHLLSEGLAAEDRLLDLCRASALIAYYFFGKARIMEAHYHASAAARMAISLGLHQLQSPEWSLSGGPDDTGHGWKPVREWMVPPPHDAASLGERIHIFWQVYNVDRCVSVANRCPPTIYDDGHSRGRIDTVWPRDIDSYGSDHQPAREYSTVRTLFKHVGPKQQLHSAESIAALRAKASALFERSARVATGLPKDEQVWSEFSELEYAIHAFSSGLPSYFMVLEDDDDAPKIDLKLALIHTLAFVARIQQHHVSAFRDELSHEKCMASTRSVLHIIYELEDTDYAFLEPTIGPCWIIVGEFLIRSYQHWATRDRMDLANLNKFDDDFNTIQTALLRLSRIYKLAGYLHATLQKNRMQLSTT